MPPPPSDSRNTFIANNASAARPLMPTLASSRMQKGPVTPRLAVQNSASPASSNASTPPFARTARVNNNASPIPPRNTNPLYARSPEPEGPFKPHQPSIAGNITPRSASRRSRIGPDSAHSSPSGTPLGGTRPISTFEGFPAVLEEQNGGLARPVSVAGNYMTYNNAPLGTQRNQQGTLGGAISQASHSGHGHGRSGSLTGLASAPATENSSSMFFHARDVKSASQPDPRAQPLKKAATFFYANGQEEESSRKTPELPSPPLSAVGGRDNNNTPSQPKAQSKFFFADGSGIHDSTGGLTPALPTPPMRTTSPESLPVGHGQLHGMPYGPTTTQAQRLVGQRTPINRSPSPTKEGSYSSYRKNISQGTRPLNQRTNTGSSAATGLSGMSEPAYLVSNATTASAPSIRRTASTSHSQGYGHSHNASTSSIDSLTAQPGRRTSISKAQIIPGSSLGSIGSGVAVATKATSPSPMGGLGLVGAASNSVHFAAPPVPSTPVSPTSLPFPSAQTNLLGYPTDMPTSPIKETSDLQAEARRERKVLDLEISNQSLLAINRGLEREVRKQKAELRRFRRLSRAGHFAATVNPADGLLGDENEGTPRDSLADDFDFDEDDDDLGSESSGLDASSNADSHTNTNTTAPTDHSSLDHLDPASSPLPPDDLADRKARQLSKDSKLLALDLSRHRELLLDSQRMNQALKRCMTLTESLIADGKKALSYSVRVSDVKLGGRILEMDEEDGVEGRHGLLSPWRGSVGNLEGKVGDAEPSWEVTNEDGEGHGDGHSHNEGDGEVTLDELTA